MTSLSSLAQPHKRLLPPQARLRVYNVFFTRPQHNGFIIIGCHRLGIGIWRVFRRSCWIPLRTQRTSGPSPSPATPAPRCGDHSQHNKRFAGHQHRRRRVFWQQPPDQSSQFPIQVTNIGDESSFTAYNLTAVISKGTPPALVRVFFGSPSLALALLVFGWPYPNCYYLPATTGVGFDIWWLPSIPAGVTSFLHSK